MEIKPLSPRELAEARELCERAVEGPWKPGEIDSGASYVRHELNPPYKGSPDGQAICDTNMLGLPPDDQEANRRFIAAARTLVPRLIATIDRMTGEGFEDLDKLKRLKNEADHNRFEANLYRDGMTAEYRGRKAREAGVSKDVNPWYLKPQEWGISDLMECDPVIESWLAGWDYQDALTQRAELAEREVERINKITDDCLAASGKTAAEAIAHADALKDALALVPFTLPPDDLCGCYDCNWPRKVKEALTITPPQALTQYRAYVGALEAVAKAAVIEVREGFGSEDLAQALEALDATKKGGQS